MRYTNVSDFTNSVNISLLMYSSMPEPSSKSSDVWDDPSSRLAEKNLFLIVVLGLVVLGAILFTICGLLVKTEAIVKSTASSNMFGDRRSSCRVAREDQTDDLLFA